MARYQKSIENKIEKNMERITSLEEELKVSRSNEKSIQDKIKSFEKEIRELKDENAMLVEKLQEMEGKIKKLENESEAQKAFKHEEDSVLILVQIGTAIQRNMCKYVLGKYFKNWLYYKFKEINNHIEKFVQPSDRESAKRRLKELNDKIAWDQNLVDSLKNLKQKRSGIAHPELSSEKIQQATEFLKERGELDEEVVENIKKLEIQWETSEALSRTSNEESQDESASPRNLSSTTRQNTRKAAGGLVNPRSPKRARKCQTSSTEGQDQNGQLRSMSPKEQNKDTYASKAAGDHHIPTTA